MDGVGLRLALNDHSLEKSRQAVSVFVFPSRLSLTTSPKNGMSANKPFLPALEGRLSFSFLSLSHGR